MGSTEANGAFASDMAEGEDFCGYSGQLQRLVNNPG
jgi:hypothetical protein